MIYFSRPFKIVISIFCFAWIVYGQDCRRLVSRPTAYNAILKSALTGKKVTGPVESLFQSYILNTDWRDPATKYF